MVHLEGISFSYPHRPPVFVGFGLRIFRGEIWSVIGPSGGGKSTLLLLIAGLVQPQEGRITVLGRNLDRPRPGTGLILQDYGLLPWATVRENVALGLRVQRFYGPDGRHAPAGERVTAKVARDRVEHWLDRLGIAGLAEQYPGQISGGQRQRAAIARALALAPDLLLMDEPFSALDAPTREDLQALALQLASEANLTLVLVTHNIEEAAFVGQRILVLGPPPNQVANIIESQHAADAGYRRSADYSAVCAHLREALAVNPGYRAAVAAPPVSPTDPGAAAPDFGGS
ncbi:MAG: ATP-binding cassette domain-containing protein [Anaerolineae bacterium]|nr:ATP-binding cassette domain-containing protein [Anaerolineae bacterium]